MFVALIFFVVLCAEKKQRGQHVHILVGHSTVRAMDELVSCEMNTNDEEKRNVMVRAE